MASWSGRDLAYACFLFTGAVALAISGLSAIPMDTGTAGGLGFLVALPLFGAAMIAVAGGIVLTVIRRDDRGLWILALLSVAYLVQFFADWGSPAVAAAMPLAYGATVVTICGVWFFSRRGKRAAGPG